MHVVGVTSYRVYFGGYMNLVKDNYNIDEEILLEKSEESDYWEKSYNFYMQVKEYPIDRLSFSQEDWLDKIEQDTSVRVW